MFVKTTDFIRHFLSRPIAEIRQRKKLNQLSDHIHFLPEIHAERVLAEVRAMKPDLGLVYGSPVLKPSLFEIPTFGTLGIHHGKVPEYRGKKTTFWAMFNGEETAGVTIQKIASGIDTGQVVEQGETPIGHRALSRVWNELEAVGLDLYIQAILKVKQGSAKYEPQVGKKGPLYKDPKIRDILSLWRKQWRKRISQSKTILS
ncbi:MAG: formyltransferase family protein [Planctomycetota bacterium]|jgi:methionyl-tRNA formyltransferase